MRRFVSSLALAGLMPVALGAQSPALAQVRGVAPRQPVTVAVKEITNNASGVWWWSPRVSKQLTDMLSNELKSTGNFTLVERAGVKQVLDEQELAKFAIKIQALHRGNRARHRVRNIKNLDSSKIMLPNGSAGVKWDEL